MGRRSSGGRSMRSAPRPAPRPAAPSPAPATHAPAPAPASTGLGAMIADGLAWGTGNAVAHRVVEAVVGPRTVQVEHVDTGAAAAAPAVSATDACSMHNKAFQDCLNGSGSGSDISKCQYYMDMLAQCKRNSGSQVM